MRILELLSESPELDSSLKTEKCDFNEMVAACKPKNNDKPEVCNLYGSKMHLAPDRLQPQNNYSNFY